MIGRVYAGLHQVSCDMCGNLVEPDYAIKHKDGSTANICSVCYGKCLCYDKFNTGVKDNKITVSQL